MTTMAETAETAETADAQRSEQAAEAPQIVDVVVRWAGTPVSVEQVARGERFTVGGAGGGARHFVCLHPSVPSACFTLVEHRADGVWVHVPPGAPASLQGRALTCGPLAIPHGQRACVALGALTFEVTRRPPSGRARGPLALDVGFLRISATSLVLHLGLIGALLLARDGSVPLRDLTPAHELIARTTRAIVRRADPRPLALAPMAPSAAPRTLARVPAPPRQAARREDPRALARAALAELHLDAGAASSAFGPAGPRSSPGLRGMAAGGSDGLATRAGPGIVGAVISIGGLGGGTDDPRDLSDIPVTTRPHYPATVVPRAEIRHEDGLKREEIERVMRRAHAQVKACYERELSSDADLEGKLVMAFTVAGTGAVAVATVAQNTLPGAAGIRAGACVQRVVGRLQFPPPRGAGTVGVTYPFVLTTSP